MHDMNLILPNDISFIAACVTHDLDYNRKAWPPPKIYDPLFSDALGNKTAGVEACNT